MRRLLILLLQFHLLLAAVTGIAQEPDEDRGIGQVDAGEDVDVGRLLLAVIGIDDYRHWPKLDNGVSDATGLQRALVDKAGFTLPVEPLLDDQATKAAIMTLVEDRLPGQVQPDDRLIVFFAGHGHTRVRTVGDREVETGYLVPVEAPVGQNEQWSAYIRLDRFLDAVNELPARHVLVILDACHSGFALGSTVEKFRGSDEFRRELSRKVSRRVITSAQRDQLASDRGPLPGHSLFTGALVDGLAWGKIDIDANGFVSSSEIGLYLQQTVGQATGSRQTPDFGAFGLDDRGELVISLNNQSFSALTARAMNALHHGRESDFVELTEQLAAIRPDSPETRYLEYRLGLQTGDTDRAIAAIVALADLHFDPGAIPLGREDLWDLQQQLPWWRPVLQLAESDADIEVAPVLESGTTIAAEPLGEVVAHRLPAETAFRLRITNRAEEKQFVNLFLISEAGRIRSVRLWESFQQMLSGMAPGETWHSLPLQKPGLTGIEELRLIVSREPIEELLIPPDAKSRAMRDMSPEARRAIADSRRRTIRLVPPAAGRPPT